MYVTCKAAAPGHTLRHSCRPVRGLTCTFRLYTADIYLLSTLNEAYNLTPRGIAVVSIDRFSNITAIVARSDGADAVRQGSIKSWREAEEFRKDFVPTATATVIEVLLLPLGSRSHMAPRSSQATQDQLVGLDAVLGSACLALVEGLDLVFESLMLGGWLQRIPAMAHSAGHQD
ncbi:hypothetical protein BDW62DRAFT_203447 [Aspergillus aurantiobrunneus]